MSTKTKRIRHDYINVLFDSFILDIIKIHFFLCF